MPYRTGTKYNFENRLHSLATGLDDLTTFALEGNGYAFSGAQKQHINQEFRHIRYELSGVSPMFTGNYIV